MKSIFKKVILVMAVMAGLSSCNDSFIYDDEGDCTVTYKVRFVYDMNLKWADAFASEVKSVNLYAFTEEGKFVKEWQESGEELTLSDFAITLDIPYGRYQLVAWCGLENAGATQESFTVPEMTPGVSDIEELTCALNTYSSRADEQSDVYSDKRLYFLYHGMIGDADLVDTQDGRTYYFTMPLTKDTNHIRVLLQELDGEVMDPADYDIRIEAADGLMAYNNALLGNTVVNYLPWATEATELTFEQDGATVTNYGISDDFSTSRMMADQQKSFLLTIRNSNTGDIIARVPVVQYALLAKEYYEMAYEHPMTNQEFLDREDEYEITFFLQGGKWVSSFIMINSWRIVLHNYDLN